MNKRGKSGLCRSVDTDCTEMGILMTVNRNSASEALAVTEMKAAHGHFK